MSKTERDEELEFWSDWLLRQLTILNSDWNEKGYVRIIGFCLDYANRPKNEQGERKCG